MDLQSALANTGLTNKVNKTSVPFRLDDAESLYDFHDQVQHLMNFVHYQKLVSKARNTGKPVYYKLQNGKVFEGEFFVSGSSKQIRDKRMDFTELGTGSFQVMISGLNSNHSGGYVSGKLTVNIKIESNGKVTPVGCFQVCNSISGSKIKILPWRDRSDLNRLPVWPLVSGHSLLTMELDH